MFYSNFFFFFPSGTTRLKTIHFPRRDAIIYLGIQQLSYLTNNEPRGGKLCWGAFYTAPLREEYI